MGRSIASHVGCNRCKQVIRRALVLTTSSSGNSYLHTIMRFLQWLCLLCIHVHALPPALVSTNSQVRNRPIPTDPSNPLFPKPSDFPLTYQHCQKSGQGHHSTRLAARDATAQGIDTNRIQRFDITQNNASISLFFAASAAISTTNGTALHKRAFKPVNESNWRTWVDPRKLPFTSRR